MNFFAHPGHDHSKMLGEQRQLDLMTLMILVATGIVVIGIFVTVAIIARRNKQKSAGRGSLARSIATQREERHNPIKQREVNRKDQ